MSAHTQKKSFKFFIYKSKTTHDLSWNLEARQLGSTEFIFTVTLYLFGLFCLWDKCFRGLIMTSFLQSISLLLLINPLLNIFYHLLSSLNFPGDVVGTDARCFKLWTKLLLNNVIQLKYFQLILSTLLTQCDHVKQGLVSNWAWIIFNKKYLNLFNHCNMYCILMLCTNNSHCSHELQYIK